MKKLLAVLLGVVFIYVAGFAASVVSISQNYSNNNYRNVVKTVDVATKIYRWSDYIKINGANASYMLGEYQETKSYLDTVSDTESASYNTLLGHLQMLDGNDHRAYEYYQIAIEVEPELPTVVHLLNASNDQQQVISILQMADITLLYDQASAVDKVNFLTLVYCKYFEVNDQNIVNNLAIETDSFNVSDLESSSYLSQKQEFLSLLYPSLAEYKQFEDDDDREAKEQELFISRSEEALAYLNEHNIDNSETYLYLLNTRLGKQTDIAELSFTLVNYEIVMLYNQFDNKEQASRLISSVKPLFTEDIQTQILDSYLIVINYFENSDLELAKQDAEKIADPVLKEALIAELDKLEIYKFYQENGPKETATEFELSVTEVLNIVNDIDNNEVVLKWEKNEENIN